MKILISEKAKRSAVVFVLMNIVGFLVINIAGYLFNFEYISVFAAMDKINKYEVRSTLLMESMDYIGACSPGEAAEVWSNGIMRRNAAMQYSVLSKQLKKAYARQLDDKFPNWVTGISSPWVDRFKLEDLSRLQKNQYTATLRFYLQTSAGAAGNYTAELEIGPEEGYWRIFKIKTDPALYVYTGYKP